MKNPLVKINIISLQVHCNTLFKPPGALFVSPSFDVELEPIMLRVR